MALAALPETEGIAFDRTIARSAEAVEPAGADGLPDISLDLRDRLEGTSTRPAANSDLEIVSLLGEGGMGQVHLAAQRSLFREVAVKTVHPGSTAGAATALCEEARVTGRIEHPSVIPVHALGRASDGRPVMIMKRVEGVSWKTLIATPDHPVWENISGSHGLSAHLQILVQVCHAVAFAHSRGFAHRDLKPENVMIGRFGEVYVVDWGLAVRLDATETTDAHQIVGTPAYMAPEMVAGLPVDERTDVYLLGAILHELLTGAAPHAGDTLMMVLSAAYESSPKEYPASVPVELAALCRDALARDPELRPQTAREFQSRLVTYLQHRVSTKLSRRGHERLRTIDACDPATTEGRLAIRRALTECRFAFLQAIDEWDGNESARKGARICAERAVRVEIAEGNAAAARVALEAIDDPGPELVDALTELEARLARERAEAEQLRRIAHDLDASVGAVARRHAAFYVAALCAAVGIVVSLRSRHAGPLAPADLVRVASFMVASMAVLVAIFRKRLLRNAFSKKIAYLALFASVTMLVHRIFALRAQQPVHVILATDSFIFSVILVSASVTLERWIGVGAVFTLAGAFATLAYPADASSIFTLSTLAMTMVSAVLFRPARPSATAEAPARTED
jgi:eukaryotic-like serine/threonine-protein kinase